MGGERHGKVNQHQTRYINERKWTPKGHSDKSWDAGLITHPALRVDNWGLGFSITDILNPKS